MMFLVVSLEIRLPDTTENIRINTGIFLPQLSEVTMI